MNTVLVREVDPPENDVPVEWLLLTSLPVDEIERVRLVIQYYCARWMIEVAFYDAKQFLGLQDPQNRTPQAVQRTAPLALYLHTLVILWFAEHGRFDVEAYRRAHPWYRAKRTPSFADMLACLKMASLRESISRYPGQKPPSAKKLLPLFQALEAAA